MTSTVEISEPCQQGSWCDAYGVPAGLAEPSQAKPAGWSTVARNGLFAALALFALLAGDAAPERAGEVVIEGPARGAGTGGATQRASAEQSAANGWPSSPAGQPVFGPTIAPPSGDLERLHNGKLEALKEAAVSRLEQAIENIKANSLSKAKEQELPQLVIALLPSHRLLVLRREIGKK